MAVTTRSPEPDTTTSSALAVDFIHKHPAFRWTRFLPDDLAALASPTSES